MCIIVCQDNGIFFLAYTAYFGFQIYVFLLDTDFTSIVKSKVSNDSSGHVILLGAIAASFLIVGGMFAFFSLKNKSIEKDIQEAQDFIDSPDTKKKLDRVTMLEGKKEQTDAYYTSPVFEGSSVARNQVTALMTKCLGLTENVDAEIDAAFQDAIDECEYAN